MNIQTSIIFLHASNEQSEVGKKIFNAIHNNIKIYEILKDKLSNKRCQNLDTENYKTVENPANAASEKQEFKKVKTREIKWEKINKIILKNSHNKHIKFPDSQSPLGIPRNYQKQANPRHIPMEIQNRISQVRF